MTNQSLNYIPTSPDQEAIYPLSGNAQLVVTTYEDGSRSSPVDVTLQGLTRDQVNTLTHVLIHGDDYHTLLDIAGDEDDIATCEAIAEGGLSTPRTKYDRPVKAVKASKSSSNGQGSSGIKRARITSDELTEAIDILRIVDPQGIAKSQILEESGVTERLWIPAMKSLIESGEWRVEGVKRGARYYAN